MQKLLALHSRPPTDKAQAALRRLRGLHSLAESGEWYADLLYKIFADCDVGLFGGRLMGMVYLTYFHPVVELVLFLISDCKLFIALRVYTSSLIFFTCSKAEESILTIKARMLTPIPSTEPISRTSVPARVHQTSTTMIIGVAIAFELLLTQYRCWKDGI